MRTKRIFLAFFLSAVGCAHWFNKSIESGWKPIAADDPENSPAFIVMGNPTLAQHPCHPSPECAIRVVIVRNPNPFPVMVVFDGMDGKAKYFFKKMIAPNEIAAFQVDADEKRFRFRAPTPGLHSIKGPEPVKTDVAPTDVVNHYPGVLLF